MPAVVITAQPSRWQRRARTAGRYALAVAVTVLHLAVAAIVLAARITHVITTLAATGAAYTELHLAKHTGRPALGNTAGVAIAAAFAAEFRDGCKTATR